MRFYIVFQRLFKSSFREHFVNNIMLMQISILDNIYPLEHLKYLKRFYFSDDNLQRIKKIPENIDKSVLKLI